MCGEHLLATRTDQSADTAVSPRLWQLQGEAYAAQGQWDTAQRYLREALDAAQVRGLPTLGWRMRRSLAHIYQQIHWHEEARAEFVAAHQIIDTLADQIPTESLRETFLREARALVPLPRSRTSRQTARQDVGGLTARELEVAIQLARGRSNREIAAALVVTERTVEYHVGNILGKLNLSSRSQVAVWAVEHGLSVQAPEA
jgi:DNA-binding CsgD family transcriptional regulator